MTDTEAPILAVPDFTPPHPGSQAMPRWDAGELPPAPVFRWTNLAMLIGPGLVMGAAAIGGGEWLLGPMITARFGGALLWLATLSILGQVIYNVEISRYALYCGEPIFTGKFRTPPGPALWLLVYLLLDFGSFLPYLAANAVVPLFAMVTGELPDRNAHPEQAWILKAMSCGLLLSVLIPLTVGGKVYNSMKAVMSFKLVFVLSFLVFLAVFYSSGSTWGEIFSGFFKFGNVPVPAAEDLNRNGIRDEDEAPHVSNYQNVFASVLAGRGFPQIDWTVIGLVAAMAAISGNGGLTNTPISNYTRDQGWGMGGHVGAIPSMVGGHSITLSHVGMVFPINAESLSRWRGWLRHVMREQWMVWMPACFIGLALPSMLSVEFLPRGIVLKPSDQYLAAVMTADGVMDAVGGSFGPLFWNLTLFCGFLVLGTSMVSTVDGVLRRWIDVLWTGLPQLRTWDTKHIGRLYFSVLCGYLTLGVIMLIFVDQGQLVTWSTMIYNYALGFSCFHVFFVNLLLLPKEIRPGWFPRAGLLLGGVFFTVIAVMSMLSKFADFGWIKLG